MSARTLVISSPNSDRLTRLGEVARPYYLILTPWTLEEICIFNEELRNRTTTASRAAQSLIPKSDEELKELYDIFGGIPRTVFTATSVEDEFSEVESLVGDVPLEHWRKVFKSHNYHDIPRLIPGKLVHILPGPSGPSKVCARFASNRIARTALKVMKEETRFGFLNFLESASSEDNYVSNLRGLIFEDIVHERFYNNKAEGDLVDLGSPADKNVILNKRSVKFPPLTTVVVKWKDLSDLSNMENGHYYRPDKGNFEGFDGFFVTERKIFDKGEGICVVCVQATISSLHGSKHDEEDVSKTVQAIQGKSPRKKLCLRSALQQIESKANDMLGHLAQPGTTVPVFVLWLTTANGIKKAQKLARSVQAKVDAQFKQFAMWVDWFNPVSEAFAIECAGFKIAIEEQADEE